VVHFINPLSAIVLFAGAIGAAVLACRFNLQRPTLWRALRCLAGGAVMGCGAAAIPGGNTGIDAVRRIGLRVLAFGLMLAVMVLGFTR
jgi:hypothetical protein